MTKNYKTSISAIIIAMFLSSVVGVFAQNFVNNTNGSYIAAPEAVIKIKNAAGAFSGSAALGTATSRIQGTVDWAAAADQTIPGLHFTNLTATGGTKTIADGVHVGGAGSAAPLPAYSTMTVGRAYVPTNATRTYDANSTFYYDSTNAQFIFAENGASGSGMRYQTLDLSGIASVKTTEGNITMDRNLLVHPQASMVNKYAFSVGEGASLAEGNITNNYDGVIASSFTTTGTGTFTVDGAIFLVDGGTLATQSTGHFTVTDDGTLTLATGTNGDGKLAMTGTSYLDVAGTFTNTATDHANMDFADGTTVRYSGTTGNQNVVATVNTAPTNQYAELFFTNDAVKVLEATADADIYARSNVDISGGNVVVSATNNNDETRNFYTNATGGSKIKFPVADMPYIQGNVVLDGTISTDVAYTLNNYETQITFATAPTSFAFNVQAAIAPPKGNDFNPTHDVSRSIFANFAGNPTGTIIKNLRVGYATTDLLGGFTADERLMRYLEGYDAAQPTQKITGGMGIATNSATVAPGGTHWVNLITNATDAVELVAAAGGGTIKQVSDKSNIILSATPLLFIAVNNGRWTNPNTWDEGIYPSSTDNALIRALVYTGMDGGYGTAPLNNSTSEQDVYVTNVSGDPRTFNGALSHSITIDTDPNATDALPYGLIIGNKDLAGGGNASSNPENFIARSAMAGTVGGFDAGIYNNNPGVNAGNWNDDTLVPSGTNLLYGLWVSNVGNSATNTVNLTAPQIVNAGTITNHSVIEIGN